MTTTSSSLVAAVVGVLTAPGSSPAGTATDAGPRVYAPRDWPTWDKQYPALFVSAPRERKESLGRNQPQFTTTSNVRIWARASAPGSAMDGSAGQVEDELWNLQRQIETAIINAPATTLPIQQFASVETQIAFDSTGEKHLGAMVMDFELEFYQGPADFYPIVGTTIADLMVTTPLPTATAGQPLGIDIALPQ